MMPKTPTTLLMDDIHLRKSSTVSEVKPPTIGMNELSEYLAVLIRSPSEVSVRSPCMEIIPVSMTIRSPITATEAFLSSFAILFT